MSDRRYRVRETGFDEPIAQPLKEFSRTATSRRTWLGMRRAAVPGEGDRVDGRSDSFFAEWTDSPLIERDLISPLA